MYNQFSLLLCFFFFTIWTSCVYYVWNPLCAIWHQQGLISNEALVVDREPNLLWSQLIQVRQNWPVCACVLVNLTVFRFASEFLHWVQSFHTHKHTNTKGQRCLDLNQDTFKKNQCVQFMQCLGVFILFFPCMQLCRVFKQ